MRLDVREVVGFARAHLLRAGARLEDAVQVEFGPLYTTAPEGSPERAELDRVLGEVIALRLFEPQFMGSTIWNVLPEGRDRLFRSAATEGHQVGDRLGPWIIVRRLGGGGQADAFLVVRESDTPSGESYRVAKVLKHWSPTSKNVNQAAQHARFAEEISILEALSAEGCPGIVSVEDKELEPKAGGQPWYVMPFYKGGSLRTDQQSGEGRYAEEFGGRLDRVLEVAAATAETLAFMHEHGNTHRDVTTNNIYLETPGGRAVLGDFGLVQRRLTTGAQGVTGSNEPLGAWRWRPPELAAGSTNRNDPRSDVYMLGGVVYELATGGRMLERPEFPRGVFKHERGHQALSNFVMGDARLPALNKLLTRMLADALDERITARQAAAAFRSLQQMDRQLPAAPLLEPDVLAQLSAAARETKLARGRREYLDLRNVLSNVKEALTGLELADSDFEIRLTLDEEHPRPLRRSAAGAVGGLRGPSAFLCMHVSFIGDVRDSGRDIHEQVHYQLSRDADVERVTRVLVSPGGTDDPDTTRYESTLLRSSFVADPENVGEIIRGLTVDRAHLLEVVVQRVERALANDT